MANEMMHIGVVVPDLETAIAEFGVNYGLTFTPVRTSRSESFRDEDGVMRPMEVRYAYSRQGPPYYELIEAHSSGFFGPQNGIGFHHVGVWEADCDHKLLEMVGKGMVNEATYLKPDGGVRVAYLKPAGGYGIRQEIMDASGRAGLEEWIRHG